MTPDWLSRIMRRWTSPNRSSTPAKAALTAGTASLAALGTPAHPGQPSSTPVPNESSHVVVSKYSDKFVLYRVTDDPDTVPTLEKLQAARDSLKAMRSELASTKDSLRTARATIQKLLADIENETTPGSASAAPATRKDTAQASSPAPLPAHSSHSSHSSHYSHSSHSSHSSHRSGGWH